MTPEISRRALFKLSGAALAASTVTALGFDSHEALAAQVRPYKLARTKETRNTCPYCSVSCGVIMYSPEMKNADGRSEIIHIEGDPDHPVNKGTLCPKGAALLDFVHSPNRLKRPMHRAPGAMAFQPVSWDFALDRIAELMKQDRDANFIAKNKDGITVNRWPTMGFLAASASSNETAFVTYKAVRSAGIVAFDNQARV
jgi:formate dehydrogenase major subunit